MSISSDAAGDIEKITHMLEKTRKTLGEALATPACSGGVTDVERVRVEDMHHRVSAAIGALLGDARDW